MSAMRSAKKSIGEHGELPAGLGEVGDRGLHAGTPRSRDGEAERILCGESVSQKRANLLGDLEEEGVQVPDHVLAHCGVHARCHHTGSGSEKQTLWGLERRILRHRKHSVTPGWRVSQTKMVRVARYRD